MSDDLHRRFESLADVADTRPLTGPAYARRAGHQRTVRRRSIAFACGIVAAAVTGTVFVSMPSGTPVATVSPSRSVSPSVSPSVVDSPSQSPSARPSHSASPSPGLDCRASDLDSHAYYRTNGAMGTLSYEITVHNGARRCRLTHPVLEGVNVSTGVRGLIPFTPLSLQDRIMAPRAYAEISVRYDSNSYLPNGSPCPKPPEYRNVALVLPDGSRYALPRIRLSSNCGGFRIAGWSMSEYPAQPGAYLPAAP